MEFCYECHFSERIYNPIDTMQIYKCRLCQGKKCHLHGGENNLKCNVCGKSNLCFDCYSFDRCCYDFINGQFVRKPAV